jgi:hypothetical protein
LGILIWEREMAEDLKKIRSLNLTKGAISESNEKQEGLQNDLLQKLGGAVLNLALRDEDKSEGSSGWTFRDATLGERTEVADTLLSGKNLNKLKSMTDGELAKIQEVIAKLRENSVGEERIREALNEIEIKVSAKEGGAGLVAAMRKEEDKKRSWWAAVTAGGMLTTSATLLKSGLPMLGAKVGAGIAQSFTGLGGLVGAAGGAVGGWRKSTEDIEALDRKDAMVADDGAPEETEDAPVSLMGKLRRGLRRADKWGEGKLGLGDKLEAASVKEEMYDIREALEISREARETNNVSGIFNAFNELDGVMSMSAEFGRKLFGGFDSDEEVRKLTDELTAEVNELRKWMEEHGDVAPEDVLASERGKAAAERELERLRRFMEEKKGRADVYRRWKTGYEAGKGWLKGTVIGGVAGVAAGWLAENVDWDAVGDKLAGAWGRVSEWWGENKTVLWGGAAEASASGTPAQSTSEFFEDLVKNLPVQGEDARADAYVSAEGFKEKGFADWTLESAQLNGQVSKLLDPNLHPEILKFDQEQLNKFFGWVQTANPGIEQEFLRGLGADSLEGVEIENVTRRALDPQEIAYGNNTYVGKDGLLKTTRGIMNPGEWMMYDVTVTTPDGPKTLSFLERCFNLVTEGQPPVYHVPVTPPETPPTVTPPEIIETPPEEPPVEEEPEEPEEKKPEDPYETDKELQGKRPRPPIPEPEPEKPEKPEDYGKTGDPNTGSAVDVDTDLNAGPDKAPVVTEEQARNQPSGSGFDGSAGGRESGSSGQVLTGDEGNKLQEGSSGGNELKDTSGKNITPVDQSGGGIHGTVTDQGEGQARDGAANAAQEAAEQTGTIHSGNESTGRVSGGNI